MTEITFYVLATASTQDRWWFACKLIEKVYRNGHACYVLTDTEEEAHILDDLLWTFRPGSFIPHQFYDGSLPDQEQVIPIGTAQPPEQYKSIVNLSSQCPQQWERVDRVLEILDASETSKAAGRDRYRQYQQAGTDITIHKLTDQGH